MPVAKGTIPPKRNPSRNLVSGQHLEIRPSPPSGGNCVGQPTEWWFAPTDYRNKQFLQAIELCSTCPVKYECLMYSLEGEEFGTWGGMSEFQRDQLRKTLGSPRRYVDDSRRRHQEDLNARNALKKLATNK